jgi:hypothetical protein
MISKAIIKAYQEMYQRKWTALYFAIDLHGTIIERYTGDDIKAYAGAEEALRMISSIPEIVTILFTSTSEKSLRPFDEWALDRLIFFKYLNENPECSSNKTGDFSKKFYFNVLLDDRAGFDPEVDWKEVIVSLDTARIMLNCPNVATCKNGLGHLAQSNLCNVCSRYSYIYNEPAQ